MSSAKPAADIAKSKSWYNATNNPYRRQQGIHHLPQLKLQLFYSYFVDQVSCKGTGPPLHIKEMAVDGQLQLLPTTEQTTTWDQIEE